MSTDINNTLAERGKRYGSFEGHAEVSQELKLTISTALYKRGKTLARDQQEALDMICHKIGRIVNGDPNYDDSWVDIAGYAKLVVDRLQKSAEVKIKSAEYAYIKTADSSAFNGMHEYWLSKEEATAIMQVFSQAHDGTKLVQHTYKGNPIVYVTWVAAKGDRS